MYGMTKECNSALFPTASCAALSMSAATKTAVAAMMQLPKAERIDRLVAMLAECIAQQEDASPFLALIQMELDAPDEPAAGDSEPRANSKPAAGEPEPLAKSRRRELTAKRNELRAMLSQVDRTMGPQHGTAARDRTMGPPSSAGHFSFSHAMPPTSARWHARCDARVMHDVTPLAMHGAEHNVCGTRCDARCKRTCIDALHRRRKRAGSPISGQFGQAALGTQPAGAADGQAGAQAAHHAGRRSRLSGAG